jgi:hypothetical protein
MDGAQSFVLVFPLGDPHLLEGVQGGEDGSPDPGGVEALLGRADPDLDVLGGELLHLGEQAIAEALEERRAAREDDILEENLRGKTPGMINQLTSAGTRYLSLEEKEGSVKWRKKKVF